MYSERIKQAIDHVIQVEGGYADNADDPGGPTMYGITQRVARRHGYQGPMRELPRSVAREIYLGSYVRDPRFDQVGDLSWPVAEELVDTGVNMGVADAGRFLQRSLNAFNRDEAFYSDMTVDGIVGEKTLAALEAYLDKRGDEGETILVRALDCLQGAEYIALTESNDRYETFVYGWLRTRVGV